VLFISQRNITHMLCYTLRVSVDNGVGITARMRTVLLHRRVDKHDWNKATETKKDAPK